MNEPQWKPSYDDLLRWWKQEQELLDTPIGRAIQQLKSEAYRLTKEHAAYQKTILDYSAMESIAPVIRTSDEQR